MQRNRTTVKKRFFWFSALVLVIILIKVLSAYSNWIETVYALKVYAGFSSLLRKIFGWLPFSMGDIFYLLAIFWLIWNMVKFSVKAFKKQLSGKWFARAGYKLLIIAMVIYIIFNLFWGLNYNRKGIVSQLDLKVAKIDTYDLKLIENLLVQKVNESKQALINQHAVYPTNKELFARAFDCYRQTEKQYTFINYNNKSVKRSMFSWWGNYFGFTGYYNPFSGEAQLNTTVPKFILPYTTTHEMAHQLGYAKEEEANFVGYLAATSSNDTLFHYSTYLDLFVYANRKLFYSDSLAAKVAVAQLIPEVKADLKEWKDFLRKHESPLEPLIRWAYGSFLKANQQPKGVSSYDEVIIDLIAFYKKYGRI